MDYKKVFITEDNIWDYADGIDFCVIFSDRVTNSYTKEEFKNIQAYPKNCRKYWIIKYDKYGSYQKEYIALQKEILIDENGKIFQEV